MRTFLTTEIITTFPTLIFWLNFAGPMGSVMSFPWIVSNVDILLSRITQKKLSMRHDFTAFCFVIRIKQTKISYLTLYTKLMPQRFIFGGKRERKHIKWSLVPGHQQSCWLASRVSPWFSTEEWPLQKKTTPINRFSSWIFRVHIMGEVGVWAKYNGKLLLERSSTRSVSLIT
jgi:hypothetical protein